MSIFTMADLHLSLGTQKPMDVFAGWEDYVSRMEQNWRSVVGADDTVVIGGDISWAMKLEEALRDFEFIDSLPGKKLLLKGNHDYWWTTMAKMNEFLGQNFLDSIKILFNNSYEAEGLSLCGTRGWMTLPGEEHDEKIMAREVQRLRTSLAAAKQPEKLVFLHYPPLTANSRADELIDLMHEYGVRRCFYGHLHAAAIRWAVQGEAEGIEYKLVSADSLAFEPLRIVG